MPNLAGFVVFGGFALVGGFVMNSQHPEPPKTVTSPVTGTTGSGGGDSLTPDPRATQPEITATPEDTRNFMEPENTLADDPDLPSVPVAENLKPSATKATKATKATTAKPTKAPKTTTTKATTTANPATVPAPVQPPAKTPNMPATMPSTPTAPHFISKAVPVP